jgi:hypothetical protein
LSLTMVLMFMISSCFSCRHAARTWSRSANGSIEPNLLVSPLIGGPVRLRPFALALHSHQRKSSCNLHLQYLAKSQSTPCCQSLITKERPSTGPWTLRSSDAGAARQHRRLLRANLVRRRDMCREGTWAPAASTAASSAPASRTGGTGIGLRVPARTSAEEGVGRRTASTAAASANPGRVCWRELAPRTVQVEPAASSAASFASTLCTRIGVNRARWSELVPNWRGRRLSCGICTEVCHGWASATSFALAPSPLPVL